jgi:hypothetical protein
MRMRIVRGISTPFGFKRRRGFVDDQMHAAQHLGQHMVGFQLQVIGLEFHRHVAVAQVIRGLQQIAGCTMFSTVLHTQHGLMRGDHTHQAAVFGHRHVTTAHNRAPVQKKAQAAACGIDGVKAAFLARVPVQFDRGATLHQHL